MIKNEPSDCSFVFYYYYYIIILISFKLKGEAKINRNGPIYPAKLPMRETKYNLRGVVAGWGKLESTGKYPMELQKLSVVTMDLDDCAAYHPDFLTRNDAFCAHKDFNRGYGACFVCKIREK